MNAKKEFLETIKDKVLICAKIGIDKSNSGKTINWFTLKDKYSMADFNKFYKDLDFEYDNGYGSQQLFGLILFEDSWADRNEYDGSEWWEDHKVPTVKEVLSL